MVRAQAEAVVAAASQPILIQVAQEASMKDMANRFQAMSERLMTDPDIRRSAEEMQQKLMSDPETRQLLEELMRRLGGARPDELQNCRSASRVRLAAAVGLRFIGLSQNGIGPVCRPLQDLLLLGAGELLVGDRLVEQRLQVGDQLGPELGLGDRRLLRRRDLATGSCPFGEVGLQLSRR